MQNTQLYTYSHLNAYKKSHAFIKPSASRNVPISVASHTPSTLRTFSHSIAPLSSTKKHDANSLLAVIDDPLWKRVCAEILTLMGPIAVQIFQVELGVPQDKTLDLYCKTEEIAQFIRQYTFIILDALKQYFPALKNLKLEVK